MEYTCPATMINVASILYILSFVLFYPHTAMILSLINNAKNNYVNVSKLCIVMERMVPGKY